MCTYARTNKTKQNKQNKQNKRNKIKQTMKFLHKLLFPAQASQLAYHQTLNLDYCKRLDKKKAESYNMLLDMKKLKAKIKDLNKTLDARLRLNVRYEGEVERLYGKLDKLRRPKRNKEAEEPTYLPEKIVDMRNNKYCIKWQGWEEPTWEHSTAEVIRLNPHLVQAYRSTRKR